MSGHAPNHEHQYIFAAAILQSPIMGSLHDKTRRSISTPVVDFQDLIYVVGVTKPVSDMCDYYICTENKSKQPQNSPLNSSTPTSPVKMQDVRKEEKFLQLGTLIC